MALLSTPVIMMLLITSASEKVQNGNMLVYSALLTHLCNVLQSDRPMIYQALAQKWCRVLPDPFSPTPDENGRFGLSSRLNVHINNQCSFVHLFYIIIFCIFVEYGLSNKSIGHSSLQSLFH